MAFECLGEYNRFQQKSEPVVVFHIALKSPFGPLISQKADDLPQISAVCSQVALEPAHFNLTDSGHRGAKIDWKITNAASIPMEYPDILCAVQT